MSILLDGKSRVLVQGITGRAGRAQTRFMLDYGTNIVAGVSPGKGGEEVDGVPVFNTVREAVASRGAEASVLFVPPPAVKEAAIEAVRAGIRLVAVIAEGVPVHDVMEIREYTRGSGACLIGPASPGMITPGQAKIGILPGNLFRPGRIGVISRSGTLSYEMSLNLGRAGIGQSTVVGIGGDRVVFTGFPAFMALFENDPDTDLMVMVGEVGGSQEQQAAEFIKRSITKPVVAYIAGYGVPEGKLMGHAGAIVQGGSGTAEAKARALRQVGVKVARYPAEVVQLVRESLSHR